MSTHPTGLASVSASDPARLLDELKRIAVEQLGAVPGGLYQAIEDQLHDSLRVGSVGGQRKDLMTVLALRQRSAAYVMRFRELVARNFDDFRGRGFLGKPAMPMGLVRENELDFHLAGQRLAESIGRRYQRPLEMLDLRFESLANALGTPAAANPVGAARLAGAFLQTFRDADISETLQPLLFRQYEQELAKVLGELYGRLNTELAAKGFHADLRRDPAATPAEPAPVPAPNATGFVPGVAPAPPEPAPAASAAASAGTDLFRTSAEARVQHQRLRDLLHQWREGMLGDQTVPDEHAPERRLPGRRELRVQELVSVASLLQRDHARQFEAALNGKCGLHEAIREELLEGARRLGLDPDHTCLDAAQEDAIDLTGLLFESLLKSHALVHESRRLFARLVMSYVKVALTDENLFVRPDHPARRLLDALALSCESNDGASPQDRELLQRASALVERVVCEYNEDLAVFELTANELRDLLEQQRRRAEVVERRSAETVHGRERLLQARLQAAGVLAQRLSGRALTPTIGLFLERHWQHHLVQVLLREGQASERHAQVMALADELIAVDEAAARGAGSNVAERVLALYAGLVECLSSSGLDDQVASEWMAGLARTLAFPDTAREQRPQPEMPQLADDSDDTRLLRVVGGTAALDFDPEVAARMRALRPGEWLRLHEDGVEGSVKVAWISPLTSRLLLVNRRGVRKLVASPEQLAGLVKSGHLSVDADELPFDQAMRQVRQTLGQPATRAA
uniref:Thymidine phosphorylase n=1 Tax=uncultured bacterium pTW3 TaxID=504467 RepID=B8PZY3_9BACT|nr:hypothetical protein [uncultured bacterium pTW3]